MTPFLYRVAAAGVRVDQVEAEDAEVLEELPGLRLPGGGLLRVTDGSTARSWGLEEPDGVVLLDWAHNPATCSRVALWLHAVSRPTCSTRPSASARRRGSP